MKPKLFSALAATTLLASGAALACDDMKMTDDGDGYSSKAARRSAAAEQTAARIRHRPTTCRWFARATRSARRTRSAGS